MPQTQLKKNDVSDTVKTVYEFVELLAFTVMAVLLITMFLFRHSVVVGDSMNETLQDGEILLISDLFYTPKQGDIVVFDDLSISDGGSRTASVGVSSPLVKRVIAVGGQHVEIVNSVVFVDGVKLEEDYIFFDGSDFHPNDNFYVPQGELYVMGDHRNDSLDSRSFGTIDERAVVGRVFIRLLPFSFFS